MEDTIVKIGVFLIILFSFIISRYGIAGLGFWGKKKKKIAEFSSKNGKWLERTFVYSLEGKNGYQGFGLDFSSTKIRKRLTGFNMKSRASSIEFTKDEAEQLVELISPYIGNIK